MTKEEMILLTDSIASLLIVAIGNNSNDIYIENQVIKRNIRGFYELRENEIEKLK